MPEQVLALVGGRVVPIAGPPLESGTVLVRGGVIAAVGAEIDVPAGAETIDTTGKWVLPGFVEGHAHVGVHEESIGVPGDDTNEHTIAQAAGVRALDGIDIHDPGFWHGLYGGVTTTVVKPGSANPFGGQAAALKTAGGETVDDRVLRAPIGIKSAFGENPKNVHGAAGHLPSTRMGTALVIRQALEDARDYRARREAAEGPFRRDLDLEPLVQLLDGELLWDVHAHRHDDLATAMRLADEFGLRLVLNHGTESYRLIETIAARGLPVVLGPLLTARVKAELRGHRLDTAANLVAAGIRIAFTTDHPEVPLDLLRLQAATAMREGLSHEQALAAISLNPAIIYGLDDRVGSLQAGLDGDIVIWSGDPLLIGSVAERVLIGGATVYERGAA